MRITLALMAALAVTACGNGPEKQKAAKAPTTPVEIVEAAADACQSVSGAYGKWLCGDPELSPLMQQVGAELKDAAGSISIDGAQLMADGQKQWVEAVRVECGIGTGDVPLTGDQEQCVRQNLDARVKEAAQAVQEKGGFIFQTVEVTKTEPVSVEAASAGGTALPVSKEIRFPKIEGDTPQIRKFNELMLHRPQYGVADQTTEIVRYTIAYAGQELVSVRFETSEYAAEAARPNNSAKAVTVVMSTGDALQASDVFSAPEARWKAALLTRAMRDLVRQTKEFGPDVTPVREEVADTLSKPQNWLITEEALVLLFPQDSIGLPYAAGGFEVKVKWADLAPMLNAQAPAPIRRA
jgi:hypothetical protein